MAELWQLNMSIFYLSSLSLLVNIVKNVHCFYRGFLRPTVPRNPCLLKLQLKSIQSHFIPILSDGWVTVATIWHPTWQRTDPLRFQELCEEDKLSLLLTDAEAVQIDGIQ